MASHGISRLNYCLRIIAGAAGRREVRDVVGPAKRECDDVIKDRCGRDAATGETIAAQWFSTQDGEALVAIRRGLVTEMSASPASIRPHRFSKLLRAAGHSVFSSLSAYPQGRRGQGTRKVRRWRNRHDISFVSAGAPYRPVPASTNVYFRSHDMAGLFAERSDSPSGRIEKRPWSG